MPGPGVALSQSAAAGLLQARVTKTAERAARDEFNATVARADSAEAEAAELRAFLGAAQRAACEAQRERETARRLLSDAIEIGETNAARRAGADAYGGVDALRAELVAMRAQLATARSNFRLLSTHSRGVEAANAALGATAARQRGELGAAAAGAAAAAAEEEEEARARERTARRDAKERRALVRYARRLEAAAAAARRDAATAAAAGAGTFVGSCRHGCGGAEEEAVDAAHRCVSLEADLQVLGAYALQLEAELRGRNEQGERLLRVETALIAAKREAAAWAAKHASTDAELAVRSAERAALAADLETHRGQITYLEGSLVPELRAALAAEEVRSAALAARAEAHAAERDAHAGAAAAHEESAASLSVALAETTAAAAATRAQLEAALVEQRAALQEEVVDQQRCGSSLQAQLRAAQESLAAVPQKAKEARAARGKELAGRLRAAAKEYDAMEQRVRDQAAVKEAAEKRGWTRLRQQVELGIKQEREKMNRKLKKQEEVIDRLFQEAEHRQTQVRELEQLNAVDDEAVFLDHTAANYKGGARRGAKKTLGESAQLSAELAKEEKRRKQKASATHRQSQLALHSLAEGTHAAQKLSESRGHSSSSRKLGRISESQQQQQGGGGD
jgi:trimeric autotransporter adhesin